ncbi:hypothetical protein [Pseudomonas sp. UBA6323]|uniref:hypothetical protein n=1 Tax=Pseudomonas sp. UBA6323 TaxID=1947329 RepID=UPI0025D00235|nr:hypothetical protein [Pseudomonas sp. UBA6323]
MTATAHVPVAELAAEAAAANANPIADLGARLVLLGAALQKPSSTVTELQGLAAACGLTLKIRAVEHDLDTLPAPPDALRAPANHA